MKRAAKFFLYGLTSVFAVSFLFILSAPRLAHYFQVGANLKKADAIVLLCAGVYRPSDGQAYALSLNSLQRSVWALTLFRQKLAPVILVSSGVTPPANVSESSAVVQFLIENGVPSDRILIENSSFDTESNAIETLRVAESKNMKSLLIVANAVQMRRAMWLFTRYQKPGIALLPAPTPPVEENYRFFAERMYLSGILFHEAVGALLNATLPIDSRRAVNFFLRDLFS